MWRNSAYLEGLFRKKGYNNIISIEVLETEMFRNKRRRGGRGYRIDYGSSFILDAKIKYFRYEFIEDELTSGIIDESEIEICLNEMCNRFIARYGIRHKLYKYAKLLYE